MTEFESQFQESKEHSDQQHEQGYSTQQLFMKQVNSLSEVTSSMGNPFMDDFPELLVLDTRNCANDAVVSTVETIEELGSTQYQQYMTNVIKNWTVSIHDPIKKNSLPLFKRPLPKKSQKLKQQVASLKSDCHLFSHLYIASKFREGNLEDFFSHENQPWPPSLSELGKLRLPSKKSDLLSCLDKATNFEPPTYYDVKLVDGPAIVHSLQTRQVRRFNEYGNAVFLPWTEHAFHNSSRVDIVWDVYRPNSLKEH